MKVVAVIDDEDTVTQILKHLGLLAAPEESRAPPAAAPAASHASPPAQAPLPLTDAPASPPTALLDSISRDLFSDAPAWDAPEPPAPDPAVTGPPSAEPRAARAPVALDAIRADGGLPVLIPFGGPRRGRDVGQLWSAATILGEMQ